MNDKIINLSAKGLMIAVIAIGLILSYIVISYGNPHSYDKDDMYQMGREVAIKEGKDKEMVQAELDDFIMTTGKAKKEELSAAQDSNVFNVIVFTLVVMIITAAFVVLGSVFGIALDPKKYLMGIVGMVVLVILVYAVYAMSTDVLPEKLQAANAALEAEGKEASYNGTGMKLAGGAIISTIILMVIAALAWIGSAVYKVINS